VGCGMVMAMQLSHRLGLVDQAFAQRVTKLIARAKLPTVGPDLGADRYLQLMRVDKKAEGGAIRFIVVETPGRAGVRGAPDETVRQVIADCTR